MKFSIHSKKLLPLFIGVIALLAPAISYACGPGEDFGGYGTQCYSGQELYCEPYSYDSDICYYRDTYDCNSYEICVPHGTYGGTCADLGMSGTYPDCVTPPAPDLSIGSLTPQYATLNIPVTIRALLTNIGTESTGAGIDITSLIYSTFPPQTFENGGMTLGPLEPGQSTYVSFQHTFTHLGTYGIGIGADIAAGGPADGNPNNNGISGSITVSSTSTQCSDNIDNDGNGVIDYPADPGCSSSQDNDESGGVFPSVSCTVDSTNVAIGGSATYTAHLENGTSNYPWYHWTASDGNSGTGLNSQSSATRSFGSSGNYGMTVYAHAGLIDPPPADCPTVTVGTPPPPPPAPSVSCSVDITNVPTGGSATYTATPANAASAPYTWSASDGLSGLGTNANASRSFSTLGVYGMSVQASGSGNPSTTCPQVSVDSCSGTKTGTISANPTRVQTGSSTLLTWSAQNITSSCVISGPGVSQTTPANSCTVPSATLTTPGLTTQSIYTLTCDGVNLGSVIVNVVPKIEEF